MRTIPCPLCGSADYEVVTKRGGLTNLRVRNVLCRGCGLLYRNPQWDPDETRHFYEHLERYYQGAMGMERLSAKNAAAERDRALLRLATVGEHVPAGANVLEVGAGSGAFLEVAGAAGYHLQSLELDAAAIAAVRAKGLPIEYGSLEDLTAPPHWDAIVAFEVLEHLDDLTTFLQAAGRLLAPAGTLHLEVPDVLHFPGKFSYQMPLEHNWHFSAVTLERLLRQHGWRVLKMREQPACAGLYETLFVSAAYTGEPEATDPVAARQEYDRVKQILVTRAATYRQPRALCLLDVATQVLGPRLGTSLFHRAVRLYQKLRGLPSAEEQA